MYQRVFFGKVTHAVNLSLRDLSGREQAALWPTAVVALVMAVPRLRLNAIELPVQIGIVPFAQVASKMVGR